MSSPRRLDDPERWLFWTVDEAAALMGPALLGLAANQFVPGLIAGVGGWLVLRRVKRGGGANIARYARFRTMTCAGPRPGTVIETPVAGFVAGSGKTGVRGPVVSREGALVEKAFLAGMVSGIGQDVSQAFQPQAVATGGGAAVANTALGDIGRAGLGSGAASAGQKVADYMIRRAEQYQPVIQLQAGTKVTLVFLEGARIDGRAPVQTAQKGK